MLEPNQQQTAYFTTLLKDRLDTQREASVRRTVKVLEAKRTRFREEVEQLIHHLGLLIPLADQSMGSSATLVQEALERLGDDAFAQFLVQILNEIR